MSKKILFSAALTLLLLGASNVFSGSPSCTPSRADILTSQAVNGSPSCTPSRADILTNQTNPR